MLQIKALRPRELLAEKENDYSLCKAMKKIERPQVSIPPVGKGKERHSKSENICRKLGTNISNQSDRRHLSTINHKWDLKRLSTSDIKRSSIQNKKQFQGEV